MSIYLAVFLWACAVVAVLLIAGAVQHHTRPAPKPQPQRPPIHTCHVRGCGRVAHWIVRRHDTGERKWVCIGCRDEGTAWGWWAA